MLRTAIIILIMTGSLRAQGLAFGVHGCGAWVQGEISVGDVSYESEETENVYGFGGDISFRPAISPLGLEIGFTYLSKTDKEDDSEATYRGHPLYANAVFHFGPLFYIAGGVNYTFWGAKIGDMELEGIDGKLGFQGGAGVEIGAGGFKLYGSAMYFIQKGEISNLPEIGLPLGEKTEFETKGFQLRAGVRFGG